MIKMFSQNESMVDRLIHSCWIIKHFLYKTSVGATLRCSTIGVCKQDFAEKDFWITLKEGHAGTHRKLKDKAISYLLELDMDHWSIKSRWKKSWDALCSNTMWLTSSIGFLSGDIRWKLPFQRTNSKDSITKKTILFKGKQTNSWLWLNRETSKLTLLWFVFVLNSFIYWSRKFFFLPSSLSYLVDMMLGNSNVVISRFEW